MLIIMIKKQSKHLSTFDKKKHLPSGESNPGIPTGRDPHHYTTEELDVLSLMDYVMGKHPILL